MATSWLRARADRRRVARNEVSAHPLHVLGVRTIGQYRYSFVVSIIGRLATPMDSQLARLNASAMPGPAADQANQRNPPNGGLPTWRQPPFRVPRIASPFSPAARCSLSRSVRQTHPSIIEEPAEARPSASAVVNRHRHVRGLTSCEVPRASSFRARRRLCAMEGLDQLAQRSTIPGSSLDRARGHWRV